MSIFGPDKDAVQWPATVDADLLCDEVREWHHTPEDFIDGDIEHNILSFGKYDLKNIEVASLLLGRVSIADELVADYAARETAAPPIVYNPIHNIIIDGNHRAEAAAARGDHDILAYVGDPATYDPSQDEDEQSDEWKPDESW